MARLGLAWLRDALLARQSADVKSASRVDDGAVEGALLLVVFLLVIAVLCWPASLRWPGLFFVVSFFFFSPPENGI